MRYLSFAQPERSSYPIALLVPQIRQDEIEKAYITPHGLDPNEIIVFDLHYAPNVKKTPMAELKRYIVEELVDTLTDCQVQYILVADSDYFKALTKATKVEANLGYVMDCEYGPWKVVYIPNYKGIFYDPDKVKAKIAQGIEALQTFRLGSYQAPGDQVIKYAAYPKGVGAIQYWLDRLYQEDRPLTCDIETFSLKHYSAGIGTISFSWNQHEGISFPVDYLRQVFDDEPTAFELQPDAESLIIRGMLREFFINFRQKIIWHNAAFDVYVLIYQLFMEHILDQEGLLYGLEVMLRNWDDTKLITYLATNSCAGNKLGLKDQAQEFAGNWAVDNITDIRKIDLGDLLQYNLVDALSTWYVHGKHWSKMIADQQLPIYEELFKPATVDIIQMQLTGMPVNMARVLEVEALLQIDQDQALATLQQSTLVQRYTHRMNEQWVAMKNATLKKKRVTLADAKEVFNPNSGPQLQDLLYGMIGLPVISVTKNKQPSTDGDTLKNLRSHTQDPLIIEFLDAMIDYNAVNKILTSFIPAMKGAQQGIDGWHYLFGNFNLGGTLSGRLSSSDPNLQNLPANSRYAKLIKSCFQAPPGWLFCGLDFNSLEDRISALTSKDPMKLKVYTDGYDGHSLRAHGYFKEDMPLILQTEGRRVFKIINNGQEFTLFEGDQVTLPDGQITTVETLAA